MEEYKNTYSVIPTIILDDTELTNNEKILYAHIAALCNKYGYCFAGNCYLAEKMNVAKSTLKKWLKTLYDKKYILREVIYKKDSKEIQERRLRLSTLGGISGEPTLGSVRSLPGLSNEPDNNISNNNINSYTNISYMSREENDFLKELERDKKKSDYQELLSRLNEKTGSQYREGKKNYELISARLEQYPVEDLLMMIDYMSDKWKGTDYQRFLRPETLFGLTKCEGYVEEARREYKTRQKSIYNEDVVIDRLRYIVGTFGCDHPAYTDWVDEATDCCIKAYGKESEEYERLMRVINECNSRE